MIRTSAPCPRLFGIGRDEIVGLVAVLLDREQAECAHGGPHQRELRDQILWRLGAVALIGRIDLLAEGILGFVENDGEMGRLDPGRALADELEQLGAEEPDAPVGSPSER